MKTEKFNGEIRNAYAQPLSFYPQFKDKANAAIAFNGEYTSYESPEEVPDEEKLTADEILDVINNKRKANARQKSMQAAIDAAGIVKPTLEDSPDLQLSQMVKVFVARGKSVEVATQLAKAALSA